MATTWGGFATQETNDNIGIKGVTQATYDRNLLERALPLLVFDKFGQQRPLKGRSGMQMVFRRYKSLAAVASALANEGEPGSGATIEKQEVIVNILQYGNFTTVTDVLEVAGLDNVILEATAILGENMGESLDCVYREKLCTGSQFLRVTADGNATSVAGTWGVGIKATVAGCLHRQVLDKAINILDRNKAKKFTAMIQGAPRDNTYPVAASYWFIIHPDQVKDLYTTTFSNLTKGSDFTPVEAYASQAQVMDGEVGKYRSARIIATTQCKIEAGLGAADSSNLHRETGAACDVYHNLMFGKDAYGLVPLDGLNSRSIIHRAGGVSDPLNQKNTVGWKAATACAILNDEHLVRIEAASLL